MSSEHAVVAVDVGGTNIKMGVLIDETLHRTTFMATEPRSGPRRTIGRLARSVTELVDQATVEHGVTPKAVGVGIPGLVEAARGTVIYAANLGWRDVGVGETLARAVGLPVFVENDVYLAGLAEATRGAGARSEATLFVAIGTGVAAAYFGRSGPVRGAHGFAGELGYMRGPDLVQDLVSARGLSDAYQRRSGTHKSPDQIVASLHEAGSEQVWSEFCDAVGRALWNAVALLDPSLVVLGGGLCRAGDRLTVPVAAALERDAPDFRVPPAVVTAAFGHLAGCMGAGFHAVASIR